MKPHYAVKSNPDPILLRTLSKLGTGFDCASGRELAAVAELGMPSQHFKEEVVYANPCKPLRDLQTAMRLGSPTTVVDSFEEVDKLVSARWTGSTLIRILVEDKNSLMPFSRKFGLHPSDVKRISQYAKTCGIPIEGVSFHVGSGCKDGHQYAKAISTAHTCLDQIRETGHKASLVDIGGGFLSEDANPYFKDYARVIRASMNPSYTYIAEPGRFLSSTAFDLFVQVIGKKPSLDGNGWRYTVDESLYGQFSCIPFDQKSPVWIRVPTTSNAKPRKHSHGVMFGRTCDSLDLIAKSPSMEQLEVGDWLWFPSMGAYTSVTASEFNGFPKPPVFDLQDPNLSLPSLWDLTKDGLKDRLPYDVTTVQGVSVSNTTIPAVA